MIYSSAAHKPLIIFTLALLMLSFPQCRKEDSTAPVGQGWTSADPVSIPLRHRLLQAERENLVKNPSFEQGRLINLDSNTVSYNVTGWKWLGENVTWSTAEVRSGSYAIKIHRSQDDKTITRRIGIASDFIRVIPGNYDFSFWIRLLDIYPSQERKGIRMYDAVDIRVLFYDKNRLLINGNIYNPSRQAIIDQSFKALPFSNFWHIDSLGWVSVIGRTTHDFLTEGDIPDEAKFVKLFFGLKGTGTMWIDDVDFRYSRRNFTAMERTGRMFDSTFTKLELIIPKPKQAHSHEPFTYHIPGTDTIPMPVIIIPGRPEKQTRAAASLLKEKLDSMFIRHYGKDSLPGVRITSYQSPREIENGGLVFNIGNRSHSDIMRHSDENQNLANENQNLGPQGYIIQPDSLHPNLVHLSGTSPVGDYYAAATAVQLFDDSLFIYHQSSISDHPDIPERAFLISPVAAASNPIDYSPYLSEMAGLKLNWAYLDFYRSRTFWHQESAAYRNGLKTIGRENRVAEMLNLAQMVNPYAFFPKNSMLDSLDSDVRDRWMHSGSSSRAKLRQYYSAGMEAGVSTLVLCTHDYLPQSFPGNYVLYAERDEDTYINLQEAHLELIRSLYSWSRARNPKVKLEFIPPWYSNDKLDLSRGQAEQYYRDLSSKLPDDLRIMWSGPARQSSGIDEADFYRFHELAGRELILLDNSMNTIPEILEDTTILKHQPMKLRTFNLFDPFSVQFSAPFSLPEGTGKMLINSSLSSEIMKIRMVTAADFMWNSESYDPDMSIWKVLVSRFGISATRELYRFNDAYFTVFASVIGLKQDKEKQRLVKQIRQQLEEMTESLENLDKLMPRNPGLLNELKSLKQSMESTYEKEVQAVARQIVAAVDSM